MRICNQNKNRKYRACGSQRLFWVSTRNIVPPRNEMQGAKSNGRTKASESFFPRGQRSNPLLFG